MKFSEIENIENQSENKNEEIPKEQNLKEIESLMRETNELNKLMQSYIRVQLNEDTMKKVTVESELESMKITSQEIQTKMVLILKKLENTQKNYAENLLQAMENGKNEMSKNNQEVLTRMNQIERTLKTSTEEMERKLQSNLNEIESGISTSLDNARKQTLINFWFDALKYGVATSICIVPVYILIKFILKLLGIEVI